MSNYHAARLRVGLCDDDKPEQPHLELVGDPVESAEPLTLLEALSLLIARAVLFCLLIASIAAITFLTWELVQTVREAYPQIATLQVSRSTE